MDGPLARLAAESGRAFPALEEARRRTEEGLARARAVLDGLRHDPDASVVLMGSWGRSEVTSGSDDDFMVLVDGAPRDEVQPAITEVGGAFTSEPGSQGYFGEPVFSDDLVENIGLDRDNNKNFTRRILFLLEARPVTGIEMFERRRDGVLTRYLDESPKDRRPPRFLLNDVVRYWRTIAVDFAGKAKDSPEKWGIRNAKLRTSRKILFAGGLLPALECAMLGRGEMLGFLRDEFSVPPTDRIAGSFLRHGAVAPGARALGAYDEFIALMDDPGFREEMDGLSEDEARGSEAFLEVRDIGGRLQRGLLALLFETPSLRGVARDYAIF